MPVDDEDTTRELDLRGVRRLTPVLRDKEDPVLLPLPGPTESGERRGRLLLVGVSLTDAGV